MLECLSFKSLPPSVANLPLPPLPSQGTSSIEATPATSTHSSPGPNVALEYDLAVQANSYNEIRSMIQAPPQDQVHHHLADNNEDDDESSHHRQLLAQVLQPDRESIREALANANKPSSTLTRLVSTYVDHSENTCDLCLLLHRSNDRARAIYAPLFELLAILPTDSNSLSQNQCDIAFDIFAEFYRQENPFTFPNSNYSLAGIRSSFSDLKQQLDRDRRKCLSRIRLLRRAPTGCALCLIGTAVGAVVTTVVVTTHAFAGLAAAALPFCNAYFPRPKKTERRELARLKQLDAAAKGTFVLNDLDTIDSLVDKLQTAVEGDRGLVQFALERERERHPIQEVLKQLRKNQPSFQHQLEDLEEHIYLYFSTVNKARSSLLQEIYLNQTL